MNRMESSNMDLIDLRKENELNQVECGNQIAIQTQNELFKLINIGE